MHLAINFQLSTCCSHLHLAASSVVVGSGHRNLCAHLPLHLRILRAHIPIQLGLPSVLIVCSTGRPPAICCSPSGLATGHHLPAPSTLPKIGQLGTYPPFAKRQSKVAPPGPPSVELSGALRVVLDAAMLTQRCRHPTAGTGLLELEMEHRQTVCAAVVHAEALGV